MSHRRYPSRASAFSSAVAPLLFCSAAVGVELDGSCAAGGCSAAQTCPCKAKCQGLPWAETANETHNFGNNIEYERPPFLPAGIEELQEYLKKRCTKCVIPVATRHSWGQAVAPASEKCEQVSLESMRGFTIDTCKKTLTVEAGTRFADVVPELTKRKLGLINYGGILEQTVVGAVMTSTHGSGQTGSVSNSVLELTVVPGAGGTVQKVRPDHQECAAGWLNTLGGLGFVVGMKLELVPAVNFTIENVFGSTHAELQELFIDQLQQAAAGPLDYSWAIYVDEGPAGFNWFERRVVVSKPANGTHTPGAPVIDPMIKNCSQTYVEQKYKCTNVVNFILNMAKQNPPVGVFEANQALPGTMHHTVPHVEMELFLEPQRVKQFLDVYQRELRDCPACGDYHVYPIIMRLIMADSREVWLSPFNGKSLVSVSLFTYLDLESSSDPAQTLMPFTKFCEKVLTKLRCDLGMPVRYHRGKYLPPSWIGARELEEDYRKAWHSFKALAAWVDPHSKVRSSFLQTCYERMEASYHACPQP